MCHISQGSLKDDNNWVARENYQSTKFITMLLEPRAVCQHCSQ